MDRELESGVVCWRFVDVRIVVDVVWLRDNGWKVLDIEVRLGV